jgi:hypothetical protein
MQEQWERDRAGCCKADHIEKEGIDPKYEEPGSHRHQGPDDDRCERGPQPLLRATKAQALPLSLLA